MTGIDVKCTADQFGDEFAAMVEAYQRDLDDQLKKDVRASGRVALKEVKVPPAGAGKYRDWDDYASGWKSESKGNYANFEVRIRNKKKPGLTHLLEKGHVVHTKDAMDGKRRSKAFPHIAPAADKAADELTRRIEGGGGRLK